jgi:hypothetical protein
MYQGLTDADVIATPGGATVWMPIRAPAGSELPLPPPEKPSGQVLHGGL